MTTMTVVAVLEWALALGWFMAWARARRQLADRTGRTGTPEPIEQRIAWLTAQNASLEGRLHLTAEARDRAIAEVEMLAAAHATVSLELERAEKELREALALRAGRQVLCG